MEIISVLLYVLVSIALGLAAGFAHRFFKNKFARVNLWLFVWVLIASLLFWAKTCFCMCGYPLGINHYIVDEFWFPIAYLVLIFAYPAIFCAAFLFFWVSAIFSATAPGQGESRKSLWARRVFNLLKCAALAGLIAAAALGLVRNFDAYWGYPKLLLALIAASFAAVLLVNYKSRKRYWLAALALCLPTFYYAVAIPEMSDRGANIEGVYSAPKIEYKYLPENDKRGYFSRKIKFEPYLKYTFHEYAGGWNLSVLKSNPPDKYYFYSASENPEMFEAVYSDLTKYLPVIDDSEKTKQLLEFLSDKSKITFLVTIVKIWKRQPGDIRYDIYIFNDSRNGFYKLNMNLNIEEGQ
ncbi:MAG: hypothetical protein IKO42_07865 [Opitutales bacterium]|nr:hypothetical protein [Opitutales bacterium]